MDDTMSQKLNLTLMENAHDFIGSAIKYSKEDHSRSWKYALLHLATALELLMKANLEKEHWSLLFDNVDVASRADLTRGAFKSVDFVTAVERLKRVVGMDISARDEKYLRRIREIRNRVMHFSIEIHVEELKSLVARGITILTGFYENLGEGKEIEDFVNSLNKQLAEFQEYVDLRLGMLGDRLKSADRPASEFLSCSECLQDTLIIQERGVLCLFCGFKTTIPELAESFEGSGGPCPECDGGQLCFILYNNEEGEFVCVKCGFATDHDYNQQCSRCGRVFWNKAGAAICPPCWKEVAGGG